MGVILFVSQGAVSLEELRLCNCDIGDAGMFSVGSFLLGGPANLDTHSETVNVLASERSPPLASQLTPSHQNSPSLESVAQAIELVASTADGELEAHSNTGKPKMGCGLVQRLDLSHNVLISNKSAITLVFLPLPFAPLKCHARDWYLLPALSAVLHTWIFLRRPSPTLVSLLSNYSLAPTPQT